MCGTIRHPRLKLVGIGVCYSEGSSTNARGVGSMAPDRNLKPNIARLRDRNHAEWSAVFLRLREELVRYVVHRFRFSRDDAQDVVQDAFLVAYERIDQFNRGSESFDSWLRAIVHNRAI